MQLNKEQKDAVEYVDGPQVIVAGPGSGKTRVIISKIEHLVRNLDVAPGRILAITFSRKAAEEMLDRLAKSFPLSAHEFNVSTFHSLCLDIVHEFSDELGFTGKANILDGVGAWILVRRHIEKFCLRRFLPNNNPLRYIGDLLGHVSRAKDEDVSPDDYADYARRARERFEAEASKLSEEDAEAARVDVEKTEDVAQFYAQYQRILRAANSVDFGDLITMALAVLSERPDVRKTVQARYDYILVDEYQDTNVAQTDLLRLLVRPDGKVCVVGDPDQSIYRFRGASFASFVRFDEIYPSRESFALTQNYRSTKNILAVAASLVSNNRDRYQAEKSVWTGNDAGAVVTVLKAPSFVAEAEAVVDEIVSILRNTPEEERRLSDFAILYRAHGHRDEFATALAARGIPCKIQGGTGFYGKEETRDIAALVKCAAGRADGVSMFRVLTLSDWSLPTSDLQAFSVWAGSQGLRLNEALKVVEECSGLDDEARARFAVVRDYLISVEAMSAAKPASEVCRHLLESTQILKRYLCDDSPDSHQRVANLGKYLRKVQEFEEVSEDKSLTAFAEYQDYLFESGADEEEEELEDSRDAVQLMTVHAAKGLEWPYVFVVSLSSARFPTSRRSDSIPFPDELMKETLPTGDFHLEEERRLAYVAFTRAQKRLYLTCVEKKGKRPSCFVQEATAGGDAIIVKDVPEVEFNSCIESYTDFDLLLREARREIVKKLDMVSVAEELQPQVELVGFIRDLKKAGCDRDWGAVLKDFQEKLAGRVDKSLEERVLDALSARAMVASVAVGGSPRQLHLSYSQISTYEDCPLAYKFGYILKVPGKSQPYFTFGNTVHHALRRFFEAVQSKSEPSLDDLIGFYDESWQSDGYLLKSQEESYRGEGRSALQAVYRRHLAERTVPIRLEWKFFLPVGDHFVKGFVDRVDPAGDGLCNIIDYKTGRAKTQKEVDSDLQLSLYAMAVKECLGLVPERLSLYFLASDEMLWTTRNEEEMEEVREKVLAVADAIISNRFDAKPDGFRCSRCDYALLCSACEG